MRDGGSMTYFDDLETRSADERAADVRSLHGRPHDVAAER